jgi:hypothetical protein
MLLCGHAHTGIIVQAYHYQPIDKLSLSFWAELSASLIVSGILIIPGQIISPAYQCPISTFALVPIGGLSQSPDSRPACRSITKCDNRLPTAVHYHDADMSCIFYS